MSPWDDATDRKLLLIIIHLAAPQLPKWDKVAELMGEDFTAEAVRQHFQKIRKKSDVQLGEPGNKTPGSTPKGQIRKPKAPKLDAGTPKSGKRKSKSVKPECDDDESPTKKVKAADGDDEWLQ